MTAPKVWIVCERNHVYKDAERFGEIHIIAKSFNVFKPDEVREIVSSKLVQCGPGDFLLFSGYNLPNAIAFHIFMEKFGSVQMLQWGAKERKYKMTSLDGFEVS